MSRDCRTFDPMFATGADPGHDVSASLIPTRFVWPYGGRRVLLSGSFTRSFCGECSFNELSSVKVCLESCEMDLFMGDKNIMNCPNACLFPPFDCVVSRWSEHVPMSPVEGCATVFQVVCRLTPGFHQVNALSI